MEIREAAEKRSMLEMVIMNFVSKKCLEFEQETGLYLSNISIDTADITELGKPEDAIVITGCTITANI